MANLHGECNATSDIIMGKKHEYWSYLWTVVEEVVITYKKEQIMF